MNSVTAGSGWNYPLGAATAVRQETKAGERGGRRAPDAIKAAR